MLFRHPGSRGALFYVDRVQDALFLRLQCRIFGRFVGTSRPCRALSLRPDTKDLPFSLNACEMALCVALDVVQVEWRSCVDAFRPVKGVKDCQGCARLAHGLARLPFDEAAQGGEYGDVGDNVSKESVEGCARCEFRRKLTDAVACETVVHRLWRAWHAADAGKGVGVNRPRMWGDNLAISSGVTYIDDAGPLSGLDGAEGKGEMEMGTAGRAAAGGAHVAAIREVSVGSSLCAQCGCEVARRKQMDVLRSAGSDVMVVRAEEAEGPSEDSRSEQAGLVRESGQANSEGAGAEIPSVTRPTTTLPERLVASTIGSLVLGKLGETVGFCDTCILQRRQKEEKGVLEGGKHRTDVAGPLSGAGYVPLSWGSCEGLVSGKRGKGTPSDTFVDLKPVSLSGKCLRRNGNESQSLEKGQCDGESVLVCRCMQCRGVLVTKLLVDTPVRTVAAVVAHLHARGFFCVAGMRFGTDLIVYDSDPVSCHAKHVVKIVKTGDGATPLSYLGMVPVTRVANSAAKGCIVADVALDEWAPGWNRGVWCKGDGYDMITAHSVEFLTFNWIA